MSKTLKQQQADSIAEILSSVKNCNDCPIHNTCDDYESIMNDNLCQAMKDRDNLNIID